MRSDTVTKGKQQAVSGGSQRSIRLMSLKKI